MHEMRWFFVRRVFPDEEAPRHDMWAHEALAKCSGSCKCRTDVYFAAGVDAGLKKRGGGGVELKLRNSVDANGFEDWSKQHVSSVAAAREKLAVWRASRDDPLSSTAEGEVAVEKRRVKACLPNRIAIEQTELRVGASCGPSEAHSSDHELWCTVSLEGDRDACLLLLPRVYAACAAMAAGELVTRCGYPEWVVARLAEQQAAGGGEATYEATAPQRGDQTLK
jgi:hypothetical protein